MSYVEKIKRIAPMSERRLRVDIVEKLFGPPIGATFESARRLTRSIIMLSAEMTNESCAACSPIEFFNTIGGNRT